MTFPNILLKPVATQDLDLLAQWFEQPQVYCWFDFGGGRQKLSRSHLQALVANRKNCARFYCDEQGRPVGFINLGDVDNLMGTADIFGLRGDFNPAARNLTSAAFLACLANGFFDFDRALISTWVVASNRASLALHKKIGMVEAGRQRQRHLIDGQRHDRICFDMTRAEFCERHPHVFSEGKRCGAHWREPASTPVPPSPRPSGDQ